MKRSKKTAKKVAQKAKKAKAKAKKGQKPLAGTKSGGKPASSASEYKPHDYAKQKADFVAKLRETGVGYREACDEWNQSAAKGRLLAGMSDSEKKRRCFI